MAMDMEQIEAEVARRLAAILRPGSPNEIAVVDLRQWAVEYLKTYNEELSRFPKLASKPHWELWMMDARSEDALFAVLIFRPGGMEFLCGTGDGFAVKRFAESDFADDVDQLPAEMSRLFAVPDGILHLSRGEAETWLGRGW
jgi:hypothetical protein